MTDPRPDFESDAFISEARDGYSVSAEQRHLATLETQEEAEEFLWDWTAEHAFYPETWFVNERGNTELLSRSVENKTYDYAGVGYV